MIGRKLFVAAIIAHICFCGVRLAGAQTSEDSQSDLAGLLQSVQRITEAFADDLLLKDYDGDGVIEVLAFGDSMTRGTGDFNAAGEDIEVITQPSGEAGYPLRVETYSGVSISNLGVPGDELTNSGLERFIRTVGSRGADVVIIFGGTNDLFAQSSPQNYFHSIQAMVNYARTVGTLPILVNLPPTCCNHAGQLPGVKDLNAQLNRSAIINGLTMVNVYHAFETTCDNINSCRLTNLPEGLHPNTEGYDVIGETIMATLLGIDIFATDGAATLEQALELPAGTVKTKPTPAAAGAV